LQAGFYFLGAERAVLIGLATVQLDAGGLAEWLKLARKITGFTTRGAVEKITVRLLCLVCSGQFAEAGEEGGDANAASDPYLVSAAITAVNAVFRQKIKGAVGAFKDESLAGFKLGRKLVGEIAQRLDGERQGAVLCVPVRGDSERMGTFAGSAEIGKQELACPVAGPAGLRPTDDFDHLACMLADRFDTCRMLALAANSVAQ